MEKKPADSSAYIKEWYRMMTNIWKDRVEITGALHTGALLKSIGPQTSIINEDEARLIFHFLLYGIYVDAGVGKGYARGNGGNLEFLKQSYRIEHNMGKARERKQWFNRSWWISTEILKDKMADIYGEKFFGVFDDLEDRERK